MSTFVIQPHVRLQEWVAEERGYFAAEGLDYRFESGSYAGASVTTSSVMSSEEAPADLKSGAFEDMAKGRSCDVSSACHWAVNAAASTDHGRMWGHAYSVSPSGVFVAADSAVHQPEDLASVEVGVGYQSGSHYSAIQGLAPFLDRAAIKLRFVGRPYDRVRLLLQKAIPAVNVFGAQYYILEQLGFRKVLDTTFMMGFLLAAESEQMDVEKYFRALQSAQREIDLEPEQYKHYYQREMPADVRALVDVRRFGPGERIVFEPYTRETFERTHRWMQAWDLFTADQAANAVYEEAVLI